MTVEIPEDLGRAVQRRAAEHGRDVAAEVVELVRRGLAASDPAERAAALAPPVITTDPQTGLPVIRGGSDAPISQMTADEFQALCEQILMQQDLERAGIPDGR